MQLADVDIRDLCENMNLITPYDPSMIQPCSIDIRLGYNILIPNKSLRPLTLGVDKMTYIHSDTWIIHPGEFILIDTMETLKIPFNIAGKFEGKSSIGRLGLMTHVTAGFIDAGFRGKLTLEIVNVGPNAITLVPEYPIGQLVLTRMTSVAEFPYGSNKLNSHYQDAIGVEGSKL